MWVNKTCKEKLPVVEVALYLEKALDRNFKCAEVK